MIAAPITAWLITRINPKTLGSFIGLALILINLPHILEALAINSAISTGIWYTTVATGIYLAIHNSTRHPTPTLHKTHS